MLGNLSSESNGPNFQFESGGLVTESNWEEEMRAGTRNLFPFVDTHDDAYLDGVLAGLRKAFGKENVLLGDAFDENEQRPLHHKPGVGVYLRPNKTCSEEQKESLQGKFAISIFDVKVSGPKDAMSQITISKHEESK